LSGYVVVEKHILGKLTKTTKKTWQQQDQHFFSIVKSRSFQRLEVVGRRKQS
jgi:hypothetical protein